MSKTTHNDSTGDKSVFSLRVLGYQTRDKDWAAHCLETDLVGYGKSFDKALNDLKELTEMQISFAFFKKQPALLDRPAPPEIFEIYSQIQRTFFEKYYQNSKTDKKHRIACIPISESPRKLNNCFVPA